MDVMEGMGSSSSPSLWGFQEGNGDLRHQLLCAVHGTAIELQTVRAEAMAETRKNEERIKQLLQRLEITRQERDEARAELQMLLSNMCYPVEASPMISIEQPETPPTVLPTLLNYSFTDSDGLSADTCIHQHYASSSPDILPDSDPAIIPNQDSVFQQQQLTHTIIPNQASSSMSGPMFDDNKASMVFDQFVLTKPLPENGRFLQSVVEAGPLLKSLLVAGSLPRWRNPPPLHPVHVPPFTVRGFDGNMITDHHLNYVGQSYDGTFSHQQQQQHDFSASPLDFAAGSAGLCVSMNRDHC